MHELGYVQLTAQGARVTIPAQKGDPARKNKAALTKIADDDAAAAVIRHSFCTRDVRDDRSADTPFSPSIPPGKETVTKSIRVKSESPKSSVYTDPGKLVTKLRREIEAINSFDGFLIGVHNRIEEFSKNTEFDLDQVLDVEKRIAKLNETLELSKFSLPRVKAEAFKMLRCQGQLGPMRVLNLLRDSIAKLNEAERAKVQLDSE